MRTSVTITCAGLTVGLLAIGCGPSYPNCDNDEGCHEGEYCVNGQCQMCRSSADCPAGRSCVGGACEPIPGYCGSTTDCPAGQECDNGRCVTATQSTQDLGDEGTGPAQATCQMAPIYFAFDADGLDGSARSAVQANLSCMRDQHLSGMHVTGYCDPRGTEEYNLALGDRRARAVVEYLVSLGADPDALSSSSMGEEMARGSDAASWSRDRRVEFAPR